MLEQPFDAFFGKTLLLKEAEGVLQHISHLEELILTDKQQGLDITVLFLRGLLETFEGKSESQIYTTVKFDGAPAIIAGIHPETKRFFVASKSLANVVPKINYTEQDVDANHGHAPGLASKLKLALKYLPAVIKDNVYQGDFMFSKEDLKQDTIDGENLITFKPNTITYAVDQHSSLGQRVLNAQIGIVFHTKYVGDKIATAKQSSDVNVSEFNQTHDVFVDDAKFKDLSGLATLTNEETKKINSAITNIISIGKKIKWEQVPDKIYSHVKTHINSLIKTGTFVSDPVNEYANFIKNVTQKAEESSAKLKTEKGKQKRQQMFNSYIAELQANETNIVNLFNLTQKIEKAKKLFIGKYNAAIKTKQFLAQPDGTLKVTAPEGYVAVDHIGNVIKLVDRLEFSKANFAVSKEEKFT